MGFEVVVHYFNPNIYPALEFERRYTELEKYCVQNSVELIKTKYNHEAFLQMSKGFENEPERGERCKRCFYFRLKNSALLALELGINKMTTTLSVSPHKISKDIFKMGQCAVSDAKTEFLELNNNQNSLFKNRIELEFMEFDFKKKDGFKKTSEIARKFGMYRQKYCGCEFSIIKSV